VTHFLRAIPYQVTWSAESKAGATLLTWKWGFPTSLLRQIYVLAAIIGLLNWYIGSLWRRNAFDTGLDSLSMMMSLLIFVITFYPGTMLGTRLRTCLHPSTSRLREILRISGGARIAREEAPVWEHLGTYSEPHEVLVSLFHASAVLGLCVGPFCFSQGTVERILLAVGPVGAILLIGLILFVCLVLLHVVDAVKLTRFQMSPLFVAACSSLALGLYTIGLLVLTVFLVPMSYIAWTAVSLLPRHPGSSVYVGAIFFSIFTLSIALIWCLSVGRAVFFSSQPYMKKGLFGKQAEYHYSELSESGALAGDSPTKMKTYHAGAAILLAFLCSIMNWSLILVLCCVGIMLVKTRHMWPLGHPWLIHLPGGVELTQLPARFQDILGLRWLFALGLAGLAFAPGLVILAGNVHWLISSRKRLQAMVPVTGTLADIGARVSQAFGLDLVPVVVDPSLKDWEILADIRGIMRRHLIAFCGNALAVLETSPKHFESIMAHEMAHLACHCRPIRRRRILSRVMLTGAGTLSFTYDCIAMENEAKSRAKEYLRVHHLSESLLEEAKSLLDDNAWVAELADETRPATFPRAKQRVFEPQEKSASTLARWVTSIVKHGIRAYDVYFFEECRFYIHPQP
jgi:hypothetical protein